MSKCLVFVAAACICVELLAVPAYGGRMAEEEHGESRTLDYGKVQRFATLPQMGVAGVPLGHPEGLCADRRGNIYADTFELPTADGYVQNYIYAFGRDGNLLTATPTPTGVVPLGCIISANKFYMNDVINGNELEYSLPLTDSSLPDRVFKLCAGFIPGDPDFCAINANYVGPDGRIYISDNGSALVGQPHGRILVLDPETGSSGTFLKPPGGELDIAAGPYVPTGSVLPYSDNGIAFSRDGSALYITNMSTNKIYKQEVRYCDNPFTGCEPHGKIAQFSRDPLHLIQAPDNMDFDKKGNLWIASGQNHHVVVLNSRGDVIGAFGSFHGFDKEGAPRGLLQPSGIIFSKGYIYIGNESNQSLLPATDNIDWTSLKLFTISRVDTEILDGGSRGH